MPRIYRTRKERESFLIREFVQHLGYRISNPRWQERPDALLTLGNADRTERIAIELTDHYNDTIAGRVSTLTPIGEFWTLVQASLIRRISHRKHLTGIHGTVRFKGNPALATGKQITRQLQARQLAEEIIDFAETHPCVEKMRFRSFGRRDFDSLSTMGILLESLRLARFTNEYVHASRCSWACSNIKAGHIAVSLNYIKSAVAQKNNKAAEYKKWGKAKERWLLIVAGGGDVNTHAPRFETVTKWGDSDLQKLCNDSPFDRIVFWERVGRWFKWLKS